MNRSKLAGTEASLDTEEESASGQVIGRAAAVLRTLENVPAGLTIAEITRATNLPRSTVQRLASALRAHGVVAVDGRRITLGPAITRLARSVHLDVTHVVRPHLEALNRVTDETANLSVLRGYHAVLVDQVHSSRELRVVTPIGTALPLHCTAHGKALLAAMDQAELTRRLASREPDGAIIASAYLDSQFATIRAHGLAFDEGEHLEGVCGIGCIVGTPTPERYALSIVMPEVRYRRDRETVTSAIRQARRAIEASF